MKKRLAYFLAYCLCFACQSPAPKKEKMKTVETLPAPQEPQKEKDVKTEPKPTPKIWDIIKEKAKLPFTNDWKMPEQYQPERTCVKITPQDFELLGLKGLRVENPYMPANYFHSHKVFKEFIAVVLVVEGRIYTQDLALFTYDKAGKLIDHTTLAFHGGDGGFVWESKTRFLNDSIFEIANQDSYFSLRKYPNIILQSTQNVMLSKAGKFVKSPIKYLVQKTQKEWKEKGQENMKRLAQGDTL